MFQDIQDACEKGEVLIEWDFSKGDPPKPLIKDKFKNERQKAKVMNFSIAYGKTVVGFAKDWKCTEEEAQKIMDLWYQDRPEIRQWQKI